MTECDPNKNQLAIFPAEESLTQNSIAVSHLNDRDRHLISLRTEMESLIPKTTYATHGVHNVYPAKFIPQVPRYIIEKFSLFDSLTLDPFAGSGTTAVESIITHNKSIACDFNPLTKFLVEIKTTRLDYSQYYKFRDRINFHVERSISGDRYFFPKWSNVAYWYPEHILAALNKIWGYIHGIDNNEWSIAMILKAAALYLSRKYSFSEDNSPKLFKSKHKAIRMQELMSSFNSEGLDLLRRELLKKALDYLDAIIEFNVAVDSNGRHDGKRGNSRQSSPAIYISSIEDLNEYISDCSIDCIITSPPYIYAQEYIRSTKIDLYWLDICDDESIRQLTREEIGQKRKAFIDSDQSLNSSQSCLETLEKVRSLASDFKTPSNVARFQSYFADMLFFIRLSERCLRKQGILAIFIGEPKVFGFPVPVKDIFIEFMDSSGFELDSVYFDFIKSRHLSRERLNDNPDGIPGEWLIVGRKR